MSNESSSSQEDQENVLTLDKLENIIECCDNIPTKSVLKEFLKSWEKYDEGT